MVDTPNTERLAEQPDNKDGYEPDQNMELDSVKTESINKDSVNVIEKTSPENEHEQAVLSLNVSRQEQQEIQNENKLAEEQKALAEQAPEEKKPDDVFNAISQLIFGQDVHAFDKMSCDGQNVNLAAEFPPPQHAVGQDREQQHGMVV